MFLVPRTLFNLQLILTEPALVYDSVHVFAKGLENALKEGPALKLA